ncbi:MAG: diacylglycerol kinase catalytic region [Thermoleophilia bacterium]|nr:diacylglycerol kinase catalytic region [Thermoleophilia bacterium]MCZ4496698.1 diacylglycerol kinase catalytic region [Thermoleophilia bacterium]
MQVLLIRNDRSGSAGQVDLAATLAERGCTVTTASIEDAAGWIAEPQPPKRLRRTQRVVVAGGDGSVGVGAALAHALDVPLGVVPAGTANDFARILGLPEDHEQACILAVTGDRLRDIDLGDANGQPFVNVASLGLAPAAADAADGLKRRVGAFAYPLGALVAAIRTRPVTIAATVDGVEVHNGRAWQAMVASTGAFGGWASIDTARDGDGQLDLVLIPAERGTHRLVFDAASLMRGDLATREGVLHVRGREIILRSRHRSTRAVVDGELVDIDGRLLTATVHQRPVRVVVG